MPSTTFDLNRLVRPNVLQMQAYSSARDEYDGWALLYLDANENPFDDGLNRYPDPKPKALKTAIGKWKGLKPTQVFLGNGSDEAIDLLFRIFCVPGKDKVVTLPPTYGMYSVSANLNDVQVIEIPLDEDFQPNLPTLLNTLEAEQPKMVFLCSPNNPTGNCMDAAILKTLLDTFAGIVVVDEAYIDFAPGKSVVGWLAEYPQLVVLQTFSKAAGMAGIRLGMALASEAIIDLLEKVKPPYNINRLTQKVALEMLEDLSTLQTEVDILLSERTRVWKALIRMSTVLKVYPSEANFLLVKFRHREFVKEYLLGKGIIVRDRQKDVPGTLRITIGTPAQNNILLSELEKL